MRLTGKTLTLVTFLVAIIFSFGCGGSSSDSNSPETQSGALTKGPIENATVFTDCVAANGEANFNIDTGEFSALTSSDGNYNIRVPACEFGYVLVSVGGNEVGSQDEAPQMIAPSNARNITPLTTLVALTPEADQEAIKAALKSLGVTDYDDNINESSTPAIQFLAQSIAAATQVISNSIKAALGENLTAAQLAATSSQIASIQVALAQNITSQIVANAGTTDATRIVALNPSGLATIIQNATQTTLNSAANNPNITITPAAVTAAGIAVNTLIADIATAMTLDDGNFAANTTAASKDTEANIVTETVKTGINTAVTDNTITGVSVDPIDSFDRPTIPVTTPDTDDNNTTGATGGTGSNV